MLIQTLKGYTSYMIRKRYQWMKKFKALWSAGYFIESVGAMSESVIRKYIDNQRVNMKPNYKYKEVVQQHVRKDSKHHAQYVVFAVDTNYLTPPIPRLSILSTETYTLGNIVE